MAGKPGRSGGVRAGAGRKPDPKTLLAVTAEDPLDFLEKVMQDPKADGRLRLRAATVLASYQYAKKGEGGVRDGRKRAAERAGAGKYAPGAAPLKLVGGGT